MDKFGNKTGGRKKGIPNKVTAVSRQMVVEVLSSMHEKLPEMIAQLDAKEYCAFYAKLQEFNIPKPQRIEIDAINVKRTSLDDTLRKLAEENE